MSEDTSLITEQPIEQVSTPAAVDLTGGLADGAVLANGETVIHDLDDQGNVIGWHKEAPAEGDA